jgi:hypothetical protein
MCIKVSSTATVKYSAILRSGVYVTRSTQQPSCLALLSCFEMPGDSGIPHNTSRELEVPPNNTTKQTPWPLVRKRTIPTERPPLVDEI